MEQVRLQFRRCSHPLEFQRGEYLRDTQEGHQSHHCHWRQAQALQLFKETMCLKIWLEMLGYAE